MATVLGPLSACGGGVPKVALPAAPDAETPTAVVLEWRAKHEADYRRDFVSIAGLHPLKPGNNSAGSAATNDIVLPASAPPALGRFVLTGQRVHFEPAPAAHVLLNDRRLSTSIELHDDRGKDVDELVVGDVRLVVHVSGETRSIRVRDPNGPLARGFLDFSWFPIDAQYRVTGRFIKDPQPQRCVSAGRV